MNLKELTAAKHKQAENTDFMKAVFARTLPRELWIDFMYQKVMIYSTLEGVASACGLLDELPDLRRAFLLYDDFEKMADPRTRYRYKDSVLQYHDYLIGLYPDADRVMAHVYTWHMGDLYGGQMIRDMISGPHSSLMFEDRDSLISAIRAKLKPSMADEANRAFDWAIQILVDYRV